MDQILKLVDTLIKEARKKSLSAIPMQKIFTWKQCVILSKSGWKASKYERIGKETDGIIITWTKEGQKDLQMPLSFNQQCLWIQYMERESKEK